MNLQQRNVFKMNSSIIIYNLPTEILLKKDNKSMVDLNLLQNSGTICFIKNEQVTEW